MNHTTVEFAIFSLGPGEIVLIMLVILLLFGAKRLPELARGLGQGIREFKGAVEGAKEEINKATTTPVEAPKADEKNEEPSE
ncbi:MAG: twin-arginine translocase TatA/TatE family subunit [Candidatus Neomarinimicrobiota bacterium]|nr:MAG: twin-arginine translocase TatA/TatE family subunit [Candidatus Neomarinimicrobiota bacterium]